jgi:hypothetical protein
MIARRLSLALVAALALTVSGALAPTPAGAAAKSCLPKGAKSLWHRGTAQVYFWPERGNSNRNLLEGQIPSVCSSKYSRRYKLQPRSLKGSYFFANYHWNGRYLYFTTEGIYALTSGPPLPQLIDLKRGLTTLKNPSPELQDQTPFDCQGTYFGCWSGAINVALSSYRGFFISSTEQSGAGGGSPPRGEIIRYCLDFDYNHYTAQVVDSQLSVAEATTLKSSGGRAVWTSQGVEKSAEYCQ